MTTPARPHVAIDLTPILPGGDNGGAKILTLALVQQIADLRSDWDFTLLTPAIYHEQLAAFDRPNLRRRCILPAHTPATVGVASRLRDLARSVASRLSPRSAAGLIELYWLARRRPRRRTIVDEIGADLLFNPFTAPFYASTRVPSVSVVYDTQFATYPQFFSTEERYARAAHLREAIAACAHLVCISDFVRRTLVDEWGVTPERATAIPIQLAARLPTVTDAEAALVLRRHELLSNVFLLFPANFWPHKNHLMLLLAFRQFVDRNPTSRLVLVCSGTPGAQMSAVMEAANRLGIGSRCRFPGFLDERDLAALFDHCLALIYPSLYEGFGMPLLEAMERRRPILCSNRTALPEVAGDAAHYFDPRLPAAIAAAMAQIEGDSELRQALIRRGEARRHLFADTAAMARAHIAVMVAAMQRTPTAGDRASSQRQAGA